MINFNTGIQESIISLQDILEECDIFLVVCLKKILRREEITSEVFAFTDNWNGLFFFLQALLPSYVTVYFSDW
jgi:hypothetical protein